LDGSHMSRANTIVCPGGKMALAMQLIFTPMIWRIIEMLRKLGVANILSCFSFCNRRVTFQQL